jgi:hypothetical protein
MIRLSLPRRPPRPLAGNFKRAVRAGFRFLPAIQQTLQSRRLYHHSTSMAARPYLPPGWTEEMYEKPKQYEEAWEALTDEVCFIFSRGQKISLYVAHNNG